MVVGGAADVKADPRMTCLEVPADVGWQTTGIELHEGDAVCLRAQGLWSHGQEAGNIVPFHGPQGYIFKQDGPQPIIPFPFARVGALIGKIGDTGLAFPIEDGLCFLVAPTPSDPAGLPGELLLSMNDVSGTFDNNAGASRVAIVIDRSGHIPSQLMSDRLGLDRLVLQVSHGRCRR
jgi:hypothetical protein